ncbi:hypothetical protein REPUB_Repub09cG0025800 [Reevesia pubescens]
MDEAAEDFIAKLQTEEPFYDRDRRVEGRLLVKRLPSDAWEKWCKNGVLCFYMGGRRLNKVYFANPRDLSIYHVTDFVYKNFALESHTHSCGCVLSGSKIYMIGGRSFDKPHVYFCDVATQPQLSGGGYEWNRGPKPIKPKRSPLVFSLDGNIYVLSLYGKGSFEVLKKSSDYERGRWKRLPRPPLKCFWREYSNMKGSFIVDNRKILIDIFPYVFVYDVDHNNWSKIQLPGFEPLENNSLTFVPGETCYCLDVSRNGFLVDKQGQFFALNFESLSSEVFGPNPPRILADYLLKGFPIHPTNWHLLHLRDTKFCLIALFTDYDAMKCYARVATFDLVEHIAYDYSDAKRLKTNLYNVVNPMMKTIDLVDGAALLPYVFCNKVGFSASNSNDLSSDQRTAKKKRTLRRCDTDVGSSSKVLKKVIK